MADQQKLKIEELPQAEAEELAPEEAEQAQGGVVIGIISVLVGSQQRPTPPSDPPSKT